MKGLVHLAAFAAGIMLFAAPVRADRTYDYENIGDTTWLTGEVITITGDSAVVGQVVIQPGVTVRLGAEVQLAVSVGGLTANGTAAQPVLFEPIPGPDPAYWNRIFVLGGGTLTLNHARIRHAREGIYASTGNVILHHCRITDIVGKAGSDGAPGTAGGFGGDAIGVTLRFGSNAVITDTEMDGIRGGKGGRGGNGDPAGNGNGGAGGAGGFAIGLARYDSDPSSLVFERNIIGNLRGGDGGDGGDGVMSGNGGNGGINGPGYAMSVSYAETGVLRNCVLHHVSSGLGGAGGAAGPMPGGNPGSNGNASGTIAISASYWSAELHHFTIDSIGNPALNYCAAVQPYSEPAFGQTMTKLVNCSITNLLSPTAYGIRANSPAVIEADTCNFFSPDPASNQGTVVDPVSFDPGFVAPAAGDYHLTPGSPLIGLGKVTTTTDDLDGQSRGTTPDIGADQYFPYVGRDFGDFDGNHCTDLQDFLYLLDNWTLDPGNGTPIGITDFLALLDNWRLGDGCV